MSINQLNFQNIYYEFSDNTNFNYQKSADTQNVSNPILLFDKFENSAKNSSESSDKIEELNNNFQTAKDNQGIIGCMVDGFKNLFSTDNCSNNIEKTINSLNENSTEEEIQAAKDKLDKYNSNQESAVSAVASTGAMFAGGAVGAKCGAAIGTAICPGLGTLGGLLCGAVVGAAAGALTNIGINQIENMTDSVEDNSWLNDKNLLKEAGEGALAGGSAVVMGGVTQKLTGAIGSTIGLESVEYGGKTALISLAEDGITAKTASSVLKNSMANALGSGAASSLVADGEYAIECAFDKDKDFSLADLGTTTASSFVFGGLIGGIAGGIEGYKGAKGYNTHMTQIKNEAQARLHQEQIELDRMAQNDRTLHDMQYPSSTSEELKSHPEFQNEHGGYSAEESAKVFETQGKSEYEIMLDEKESLAMENRNALVPSLSEVSTSTSYKLSDTSLERGTSYLAQEGTLEYDAVYNTVKENFVVVKSKEEAMEIFRRQFSSVDVLDDEIFVLNPSNPAKVAKKINTSNEYMSQWFAEANGLEGRVVTTDTIQEALSNCSSKQITIFIPDDCAVTGSSLIMNTANTINKLSIPEGINIRLVYSPLIQSNTAEQAFSALSAFDFEMLQGVDILSKNSADQEIVQSFIEQHCENISISVAEGGIKTMPYYKTEYFLNLKEQNPEVAQAVEAILTNNGSLGGHGRPGQSGVMIATPNAEGVLKCPNNNPYGAAPYALAEGATPMTIKSPNSKNIKKWHTRLQKILDTLNKKVA